MDDAPPPPLPKRPTIIRGASQSQPAGTQVPSTRVPVRPAPPKPSSRPASVHVPSKEQSPTLSSNKSNGGTAGKRKIEITIVDARPMSEIGFRDDKLPGAESPRSPASKDQSQPPTQEVDVSTPSLLSTTPAIPPPPKSSQSHENMTSPSAKADGDGSIETKRPLPSRPKRPTIIRPSKSGSAEEKRTGSAEEKMTGSAEEKMTGGAEEKISDSVYVPDSEQKEQDSKTPPTRASMAVKSSSSVEPVDPGQSDGPKSQTLVGNDLEQLQSESHPTAPAKPKRPTIIRPGRSTLQDGPIQDSKLLGLPSRPSQPTSNIPPPLPSKSPATSHFPSPVSSLEPSHLSPQAPLRSKDKNLSPQAPLRSKDKKPLPKPRPRSVAISSGFSLDSVDPKESAADEKDKETVKLRSVSPPPLPFRAPRPASALITPSLDLKNPPALDKNNSNQSVTDAKNNDESKQEKSHPARPKPLPSAAPKRVNMPPRPSAPPVRKNVDSDPFLEQDSGNLYETIGDLKKSEGPAIKDDVANSEEVGKSPNRLSPLKVDPEVKEVISESKTEDLPIYAKINKPVIKLLPGQPKGREVENEDGGKGEFPFKVKLKSTLSPSQELQNGAKHSEGDRSMSQSKESQQPPVIPPKLKPKPSLKSKPPPAVKPKPTSPKEKQKPSELKQEEKESDVNRVAEEKEKESDVNRVAEEKEKESDVNRVAEEKEKESDVNRVAEEKEKESNNSPLSKAKMLFENKAKELHTENQDSNRLICSASDKSGPPLPSRPDKSGGPVASRRPLTILGRPSVKNLDAVKPEEMEKVPQDAAKKASTPTNSDSPKNLADHMSQSETPREHIGKDPLKDTLQEDLLKVSLQEDPLKDSDHADSLEKPAQRKPVRIIGFPQRREKEDWVENEKPLASDRPAQGHKPPPPRPAARPPTPGQTPNPEAGSKSQEGPPETCPRETVSQQMEGEKTETVDLPAAVKPSRSGPPPPRPSSAVSRKTPLPEKEKSQDDKNIQGSAKEKPPRPQPSRPLPPRSERRKSGPSSPPALPPRPGPGHILYGYLAHQPHGTALHHYTASQPDELSFQVGETVILTKQVDDQWLFGRVGYNEGLFPMAFIDIQCPLESQEQPAPSSSWQENLDAWPSYDNYDKFDPETEKPDNLIGPRCRARFDFEGSGEGELILEDGDVVKLVSRVGSEWLKGEFNGQVGIFPSAYVEIIEDLPEEGGAMEDRDSTNTSAIFDFEGQEGDLSFQAGETIHVLGQINTEWLYGECNGLTGQFPAAFISSVPPCLPSVDPVSMATEGDTTLMAPLCVESPDQGFASLPPIETSRQAVLTMCVALHDYDSMTPGDLQFKSGDRIEIVEFVGEDWLCGRLHGEEGIFPKVFVEVEHLLPSDATKPGCGEEFGKAVHSFTGNDDTELTFEEGDVIQLEDFVDENQDWRHGVFEGKRGMFPSAFVEPL